MVSHPYRLLHLAHTTTVRRYALHAEAFTKQFPVSYHASQWLCCRLERGWSSFNYLAGSATFSLGEVDDGEAFRDTMDAMMTVGLTQVVS